MADGVAPEGGFRSRHVEVLGHRLYVREAGEGETVVLVHGLGVSGRYLQPLGEVLARQAARPRPRPAGLGRE